MKRQIYKWLYQKAAEAIGDDELDSLKSDLIAPVKTAAKEAAADIIKDFDSRYADEDEEL